MSLSGSPSPVLAPPGAGLPWWELLAIRAVLFPLSRRRHDWAAAVADFQAEGERILAIWDALPESRLTEPVLIRRIAGIEDSSRAWSVAMTVEHLCIVGTGVRRILDLLRQGKLPKRPLRVEEVKPHGKLPAAQVRADFVRLLGGEGSGPPMPKGAGPRCVHPWLGPVDGHGWNCFLAEHQRIHRKQVEAIRRGLS